MVRLWLTSGSVLAGLAVGLGAFAAHGLKATLTERALSSFETGVRYQMYHALALILVALVARWMDPPPSSLLLTGSAFLLGIAIFSGSLYALSLTEIRWLGAITPLGGVAFLIGWVSLAFTAWNWR